MRLSIILIAACALRLWGLGWGLPGEGHLASYHPDEWNTLRSLGNMRPEIHDFNPRYFHNPSLYYYACGAAFGVADLLGVFRVPLTREMLREQPKELRKLYFTGRGLSVLAGCLTVVFCYLLASVLGGPKAGLWAATFLAVAPGPVVLSHYMDVDAMLAMFTTAALWSALKAASLGSGRWAALAGVFAGLACSTKYNGVLVVPVVLVAVWTGPSQRRALNLCLAAFVVPLAFVLGTPYALLDWTAFVEGVRFVLFERAAARWSALSHGPAFPLIHTWRWGLGEALLAVFVLAVGISLLRPSKGRLLLVAFCGLNYAAVAITRTDYLRYSLPAFPVLAALAGSGLAELGKGSRRLHAAAVGLGSLATLMALSLSLAWDRVLVQADVRTQASRWLESHLPARAALAVPREPFFHSPAVVHTQYWYNRPDSPLKVPDRLRIRNLDWSLEALNHSEARLVVLSEFEVLYPAASPNARLLDTLLNTAEWAEIARFENRPGLLGFPLEPPFPGGEWLYSPQNARVLAERAPPHDLKYINPTLLVLSRITDQAIDAGRDTPEHWSGPSEEQP